MRASHRSLILACALAAAVLSAFLPIVGNDFVDFDDNTYVTENPKVLEGLSFRGVLWAFTSVHGGNWHPLTWLSHMLDVELFGLQSGGHHLTNLLLHLCNTLLLFFFLRAATGAFWRSAFVTALFALHPLRVESVAWIAQRKDVLALFFMLLTLHAYRRFLAVPTHGRYLAVCVLYAAGLMAKPILVTLPVALLLLDLWPFGRLRGSHLGQPLSPGQRPPASRVLLEKVPLLLLASATAVATFLAQSRGGAVNALEEWSVRDRLFTALIGYVRYVRMTLHPVDLAVYYPLPKAGFTAVSAIASLAVLTAVTVVVVRWRHRFPAPAFGWFWFIVTLLPVIGLLQAGTQAVADRYTLIPHLGLFILVSWCLWDLLKPPSRSRTVLVPGALLLLVLSLQTRRQIASWSDGATLFRHDLDVTTDNWLIHYNYGTLLRKQGKSAEAVAHLEAALKEKPAFADAHVNLGVILLGMGRAAEAEAHFLRAVESHSGNLQAYNNLGVSLMGRGEYGAAIKFLSEAIEQDPGYVDARYNLATAHLAAGNREEAIREFREVVRLSPSDAMARSYLERLLSATQ